MSAPYLNSSGNVGLPTFPELQSGSLFVKGFANNGSATTVAQYVTFAHAFQKGQLTSGDGLQASFGTGSALPCQVDVKTSYSDGSACHALITHQAPEVTPGTISWAQYSEAAPPAGPALSLSAALAGTACSVTLTPTALPNWTASTNYTANYYSGTSLIRPVSGNAGNYAFQAYVGQDNWIETFESNGVTEPTWPQTEGATVNDGPGITWTNVGALSGTFNDWSASTSYAAGARIKPSANNSGGYVQQANNAGESDTGEPSWNQTVNGTTNDGTLWQWVNVGLPFTSAVTQNLVSLVSSSTDLWLSGPLAVQGRGVATVSGTQLRIQADVTTYADGTVNFDVLVANDIVTVSSTTEYYGETQGYKAEITLNGTTVYTSPVLVHNLYENWTWQVGSLPHVVNSSQDFTLQVVHNPNDFIAAQCVQSYNTTLGVAYGATNQTPYGQVQEFLADPNFGAPLYCPFPNGNYNNGQLVNPFMGNFGGRPDIAPNDAFCTWGFITQDPTMQRASFECAKVAGFIPWHWWMAAPPAGGLENRNITIQDYPDACLFGGSGVTFSGGVGIHSFLNNQGEAPLVQTTDTFWGLDVAHHPDLVYLPYIQTGRRYFLDELNAVSSWCELSAEFNPFERFGSFGNLSTNQQVRATSWSLRDILYATYSNPDGSWWKTYSRQMLDNNFYWFLSQIAMLQAYGGEFYGYFAPWGYGINISPWENGYLGTTVVLAAIMGYPPAIQWAEWMANFVVGMMNAGGDSPYSGFPPSEASTYDFAAWPGALQAYLGGNQDMWPGVWPIAQSWEALEQVYQAYQSNQGVNAAGVPQLTGPATQSSVMNAVFECSISGTTVTVGTVYAGTIEPGQYLFLGAGNGASAQWSVPLPQITSVSGNTLTLSAEAYAQGGAISSYSGSAASNFCDGIHIGPGIMWNANYGSAGSYGDYSQLVSYGLANLATLGVPGASAALTALYGLTDSTGTAIPLVSSNVEWATTPLTQIVARTLNNSQVFNGAGGSPAQPTGYSFVAMDALSAQEPGGTETDSVQGASGLGMILAQGVVDQAAPATTLELDGSYASASFNFSSGVATLTTSNPNDIIVAVQMNGPNTAPTDSAGLAWAQIGDTLSGFGGNTMSVWYAVAPTPLSNDQIKWSSGSWGLVAIFGVSGANTVAPFDPNASNPASTAAWGSEGATISTSNAADFIFAAYDVAGADAALANGFTSILGSSWIVEYKIVSATQSDLLVPSGASGGSAGTMGFVIAFQAGASAPAPVTVLGAPEVGALEATAELSAGPNELSGAAAPGAIGAAAKLVLGADALSGAAGLGSVVGSGIMSGPSYATLAADLATAIAALESLLATLEQWESTLTADAKSANGTTQKTLQQWESTIAAEITVVQGALATPP